MDDLIALLPAHSFKLLLVFSLSFLIGLEREEHREKEGGQGFGGVRAFPMIGLLGYAVALVTNNHVVAVIVGLLVVGALMVTSYISKLKSNPQAGIATEVSGLTTYLLGSLVFQEFYWVASTLVVVSLLLHELHFWLKDLARKIDPDEILTFAKFLLLSVVVLPMLPNVPLSQFEINPFKTWVVVVTVSSISYLSYVLQKLTKDRMGIVLPAILAGTYSSTAATVVLAKKSKADNRPHYFSGAIVLASSTMYVRVLIFVWIFNASLAQILSPYLVFLALFSAAMGAICLRLKDPSQVQVVRHKGLKNPLEVQTAFAFAFVYIGIRIVTDLMSAQLGRSALFGLSAVMGLVDIDPFILSISQGMTQRAAHHPTETTAAAAILLATASNNFLKGAYGMFFADRKTGIHILALLSTLGLIASLFVVRLANQ